MAVPTKDTEELERLPHGEGVMESYQKDGKGDVYLPLFDCLLP
jgi:hypothetical protein